jgi:hypothetical protein
MATISDLIGVLYPLVGLHVSTLSRHASQLRVAGFLPDEDENLAALEAATFLAAVTGARAPTEAVEAARVFTSLPLAGIDAQHENPASGVVGGTRWAISSLPPPSDEQGPLAAAARRSFVAALEFSIHQAQDPDRKLEKLPTAIGTMRNLQDPYALIAFGRAETDGVWRRGQLIFGPADAVDGVSRAGSATNRHMQVWAYLPAITIPLLGDLLADDRLDVTEGRDARPGMAAVFDQRRGQVVQLPAPRSLRVAARAGRRLVRVMTI